MVINATLFATLEVTVAEPAKEMKWATRVRLHRTHTKARTEMGKLRRVLQLFPVEEDGRNVTIALIDWEKSMGKWFKRTIFLTSCHQTCPRIDEQI